MLAEIEGFDSTDIKSLQCHLAGKRMKERLQEFKQLIPAMLARLGVITGIEIPANDKVFQLLVAEVSQTIINEPRYNTLTFEEYIQAFNMASNLDFGEIKSWGKVMNVQYFRELMNPYLLYKASLMHKYGDWQMVATERMRLESGASETHNIDYKPITERCYQEYLSGKYNPFLWHWQCYDDLVKAGWVPADAYKSFEKKAKSIIIGDLNKDIMAKEAKKDAAQKVNGRMYVSDGMPKSIGKHMQSVAELTMVHNGETGKLIETRAKQLCMKEYFKQQAMRGATKLFEPVE